MAYITIHQRKRRAQRRAEIIAALWTIAGKVLATIATAFLIAWVLINWMMGCGETWVQADGTYIAGECLSITLGAF